MIINDLDGYYIVFDTKNWNTELDTLYNNTSLACKSNMNGRNYGRKYKIAFYLTYSFSKDFCVNYYK